ncbi:MAG: hypothetical protein GKR77_04600 [Legionellales bacterium]|nr:hypothetical protein [Legionellales bacterium]
MERIIFSISSEQKRWLAGQAQCQQISMAEVIRKALKFYSHQQYQKERSHSPAMQLLTVTNKNTY